MKRIIISTTVIIASIAVTSCYDAKKWYKPEIISEENFSKLILTSLPKCIMDEDGSAKAVWVQSGTSPREFLQTESTFMHESGWSAPLVLSNHYAFFIESFMNNNEGDAICTYFQRIPAEVRAHFFDADTGWAEESEVVAPFGYQGVNTRVQLDDAGNALFSWDLNVDINHEIFHVIYARRYDVINGWGDIFCIEKRLGDRASAPSLAMNKSGQAVIVWRRDDTTTGRHVLCYRLYTPQSGWSDIGAISDENQTLGPDNYYPLAIDAKGNIMTMYKYAATNELYARRYDVKNGWQEAVLLSANGRISTNAIKMNEQGSCMLVWLESDESNITTIKALLNNKSKWSETLVVEEVREGYISSIETGFNSLYQGVVLWISRIDEDHFEIIGKKISFLEKKGYDRQIIYSAQLPNPGFFSLDMATNSSGEAVAVWGITDGMTRTANIWASMYKF